MTPRAATVVALGFVLLAMPLAAEAQPAGKVYPAMTKERAARVDQVLE